MSSDYIYEISGETLHHTDKAVRFKVTAFEDELGTLKQLTVPVVVWFPRSKISIISDNKLLVPGWLLTSNKVI